MQIINNHATIITAVRSRCIMHVIMNIMMTQNYYPILPAQWTTQQCTSYQPHDSIAVVLTLPTPSWVSDTYNHTTINALLIT